MLPDIHRATVELLKGQTLAGDRVYRDEMPRSPYWPIILVFHLGSRQTIDINVEEARIGIRVIGKDYDTARQTTYEVRDVILPPPQQIEGVHGLRTYIDREGVEREITFSGARLEDGPRQSDDRRNEVISYYLVQYF